MTKPLRLSLFLLCFGWTALRAQVVILDFEAAATTTNFQYFGSSNDGQLTSTVANPNPSAPNTSSTVLEFKKPAASQTWAGAFSNPNPSQPVNLTASTKITIKVHMDHIGNLALKLENASTGGANWLQTKQNTVVNGWETLTFDATLPSEEAPNQTAAGQIYNTVTLFVDFGVSPASEQVTYIDDIVVEPSIICTTVLNFEDPATSTNFQYFGSSIDGQLSTNIANPNPGGINSSATVLQFKKPAASQVWAGAFSNPNTTTPINLISGGNIKVKFLTDHPGNLTFKLEEGQNGGPNWAVTVNNTVVNEWVELTFDPALPSIEGPNLPATGYVYHKIVLFADFGTSPTAEQTFYIDDIEVCSSGATPTADVKFQVDMNQYAGTFTNVYVSGTFNTWSGDGNPMSDPDGDKIYETTINMPVGLYEFKFTLDNWATSEALAITSACTNTTIDGADVFTNRKLVVSADQNVGPVCYGSCYGCGDAVQITFNLGMGAYTPDAGGVYLAGGLDFGAPGGRFRMYDDDGDGVFSLSVERQRGYSTFYDFANGACPDYSCKENIAGQPCAVAANFNDRWLNAVQQDTTVNTCFALCSDNVACVIATNEPAFDQNWMSLQPTLTENAVQLMFHQAASGTLQIRVYDANGQLVYQERRNDFPESYILQSGIWPKGMYTVYAQDGKRAASGRFIRL